MSRQPKTTETMPLVAVLLLLLLQRSTAVQVRSSVRLMPQNQPSGRGLLPSPTAWSSDQHPVAMLADVSRHTLSGNNGHGDASGGRGNSAAETNGGYVKQTWRWCGVCAVMARLVLT